MSSTELYEHAREYLFRPFLHRKFKLPTRVVMAAVPRCLADQGVPTPEMLRYYRRRAEQMVGLIITEPVAVDDPAAAADTGMPHFYGGAALRAWKMICRSVHATGCRMMPLLSHAGMLRPVSGDMPHTEVQPVGPSGISPVSLMRCGEAMSRERIQSVAESFGKAAQIARLLGFDGVAIDGANGGLIDQFLRRETNCRSDEYGGDIMARTRFAAQVVQTVRKCVGRQFPVVFRFSQHNDGLRVGPLVQTPHELEEFLQIMCAAGVDVFSCDGLGAPAFSGSALNLPGWTRMLAQRPVMAYGGIGLPERPVDSLLWQLSGQSVDLFAVGRALLADAEWAAKVRLFRDSEILPYNLRSWSHLY